MAGSKWLVKNKIMGNDLFNRYGKQTLAIAFIIVILSIVFSSCSNIKKSSSVTKSKTDNTTITNSESSIKKDSSRSVKTNSSELTTKDKNKTYERETHIYYDTSAIIPANGTERDYGNQPRITHVVIKEKGQKSNKEVHEGKKDTEENVRLATEDKWITKRYKRIKEEKKEVVKEKEKTGFNWFWLLPFIIPVIGLVYLAYYKRREIKSKLFG